MSKELTTPEIDEKDSKKQLSKRKFSKIKSSNIIKNSKGYKVFSFFNYSFLIILALLCLLPLVQVLATSFSSGLAIKAGKVILWPVDSGMVNGEQVFYPFQFNFAAYQYMITKVAFWQAFWISVQRVVFGTSLSMFLIVICSYPLSQDQRKFSMRLIYVWFFFFSSLFSGGLIPTFYIVYKTGFFDTLAALIVPGAVHVFSIILLLNFFRQLPKELDEAAFMDGAGHWTILFKIYLPTSLPALATITLFTVVGYWNEWFSAIIYINNKSILPLATYLQEILIKKDPQALKPPETGQIGAEVITEQNMIAAQIFIGAAPILMIYPFLQKYFAKGIVLGSVKG
ncbi:MAG: carbohydrate ABC transporter permease [Clostridia bacterium]